MTVTIRHGDCREVLATLPAESVHCVVTSPPYWRQRDYGMADQIGLELTPQDYIDKLACAFGEVRRVLRPDGVCWINIGDKWASGGNGGGGSLSARRGAWRHGHRLDDQGRDKRGNPACVFRIHRPRCARVFSPSDRARGSRMTHQCERRENDTGEWICDYCKALWYGELAETDWRPSECRIPPISRPSRTGEA